MTLQATYNHLVSELSAIYANNEAIIMANMVIEHITGYSKQNRIASKELLLNDSQKNDVFIILANLQQYKPIQYVLQEAWFYNLKFYVNEHVLIPRSETEELVELIVKNKLIFNSVLDIGSGSGCIPIAIKKHLPKTTITSIDVSADALEVAKKNANNLGVEISFVELDFLDEANWQQLKTYDVIVSNPPYIKQSENEHMPANVVDYEPHVALFVTDDDALVFYKKIALFGKTHLNKQGKIFVEINEALGKETVVLFETFGYVASLKKDMQGKDRMIVAAFES